MSFSSLLDWQFDYQKRNCWHLTRAAWLELTGRDIGDRTPERITRAALVGRFDTDVPTFRKLTAPADPSLVLMTRPKEVPHVGVFTRGRILQIGPGGVTFLPVDVATRGWAEVEFYDDRGDRSQPDGAVELD